MTEIPEHLLKRSKARRGVTDDAPAGAGDASGGDAVTPAAASSGPAVPDAIQAAAKAVPADSAPPPAAPEPEYVTAAKARKRMPMWAMGVVALVPLWAISFAGTMQPAPVADPVFVESAELYQTGGCAGCHGGGGGGGSGYQLSDGQVLETFPEPIDHIVHVARGSEVINDLPYGSAERAGGQRVSGARGVMPAQESGLSLIELELVVFHERATLSGEDTSSEAYQEWIEHMREGAESGESDPIDLEMLLACANPEYTPEATGEGSVDDAGENNCPGPHVSEEEGEEASG